MHEIAKHLKRLRRARGLTQEELAERLHVTRQAVSNWERGKNLPDLELLTALAAALAADVTEILYGRSPAEPPRPSGWRRIAVAAALCALSAAGFAVHFLLAERLYALAIRRFDLTAVLLEANLVAPLSFLALGAAIPAVLAVWRDIRLPGAARRRAALGAGIALLVLLQPLLWSLLGSCAWQLFGTMPRWTMPLLVGLSEARWLNLLPGLLLYLGIAGRGRG